MADAYVPTSSDDAKIHLLHLIERGLSALNIPDLKSTVDNDGDSGSIYVDLPGGFSLYISTGDILDTSGDDPEGE